MTIPSVGAIVAAVSGPAATAGKVVAYGALLGFGFWVSKRVTGYIDEKLLMYDENLLDKLGREHFGQRDGEYSGSHARA